MRRWLCTFVCGAAISCAQALPQEQTAGNHLQLTAYLNGELETLEEPGVAGLKQAIGQLVADTFPEIAMHWAKSGFDPATTEQVMSCTSNEDDFQVEDHGDQWLYNDDRLYSCNWGQEPFLVKIRVTTAKDDDRYTWQQTELIEILDIPSASY